jgi:site-specific DNA-cytosine methylase
MWFVKTTRSGARDEHGNLPAEQWKANVVSPTLNVFDNSGESRATVIIFEATRVDDVRVYDSYSPCVATYWGTGGARVPYVFPIQSTVIVVRRLTPMECERLQGFPDNWTAAQSDSQRYRQMGNAVTVNVIESIGQQLGKG